MATVQLRATTMQGRIVRRVNAKRGACCIGTGLCVECKIPSNANVYRLIDSGERVACQGRGRWGVQDNQVIGKSRVRGTRRYETGNCRQGPGELEGEIREHDKAKRRGNRVVGSEKVKRKKNGGGPELKDR